MTREIVEARKAAAQQELQARVTELQSLEARITELQLTIHNGKVQIATYDELLTDNTDDISSEVRETVESLVSE